MFARSPIFRRLRAPHVCLLCFVLLLVASAQAQQGQVSVKDYPSIQEAIAANPGKMIFVPSGDYTISAPIRIDKDDTGLFGPGRIIMSDPAKPIVELEHAKRARLSDLTFTRAEGKMDTGNAGIQIDDCHDAVLENLQIIDNRTRSGGIRVGNCTGLRILNCLIQNYMSITIDDRTDNPVHWGYAFNCIDGTGIVVDNSQGTLIQGNTIIERNMLPTPEVKEKYNLGKFTKKLEKKGMLIPQSAWDAEYVNNWHQGSALIVTGPLKSDYTRIIGNYIENAAQGIDIHSDHVIISNNIVNDSFMGMKAMHGSRNVIITGNQFSKSVLWAIGLMPGAGSAAASAAVGDKPAVGANVDGGSIVANNIISDFGYGKSYWIWKDSGRFPLRFDKGQEPNDPPLCDVIVTGNVIYDTGRDQILVDGKPTVEPPRYNYAVLVEGGTPNSPIGMHFSNNILHPGTDGVSNVELKP